MLNGYDEKGELRNIRVTENGEMKVKVEEGEPKTQDSKIVNTAENPVPVDIQNQSINVGNTNQNPVPVNITNTQEVETTLNASIQTVGTTASTVAINKKVTTIDVANYSETADVTITIGNLAAVIGCGIATTLTINANVTNISLQSTEADTKVQIVVKGVN